MGYYDSEENAQEYIDLTDGYDGKELIARLGEILDAGSSVLELGMGPGKDLLMLSRFYKATGSDLSDVFLNLFRNEHPGADLVKLDAVTLETDRKFDCIYSNKVLHHLSIEDLRLSLERQREVLNPEGTILHTFWKGEGVETMGGLRFVYHTSEAIRDVLGDGYEVDVLESYTEMEPDDSLLLIARRT